MTEDAASSPHPHPFIHAMHDINLLNLNVLKEKQASAVKYKHKLGTFSDSNSTQESICVVVSQAWFSINTAGDHQGASTCNAQVNPKLKLLSSKSFL